MAQLRLGTDLDQNQSRSLHDVPEPHRSYRNWDVPDITRSYWYKLRSCILLLFSVLEVPPCES